MSDYIKININEGDIPVGIGADYDEDDDVLYDRETAGIQIEQVNGKAYICACADYEAQPINILDVVKWVEDNNFKTDEDIGLWIATKKAEQEKAERLAEIKRQKDQEEKEQAIRDKVDAMVEPLSLDYKMGKYGNHVVKNENYIPPDPTSTSSYFAGNLHTEWISPDYEQSYIIQKLQELDV